MIAGLAALTVANAGVLLASHAVLRRVGTGKTSLDVALFFLLRFIIISALVIAAGLSGMLTPWGLGIAGLALLAALMFVGEHRALPKWRRPDLAPMQAIFLGAILLRLLLQVWFLAPYAGDALSYHLPKIAEWVRAGSFTREHGADGRSTFPAGFELIEAWWVVFLHHDVLIEMAGVEFFALALAASHALAVEMGLSRRAAFLGALAATCTPGMLLQATSCLNDGPVAGLLIATAALVTARAHPAIVAIPVALGLGVKPVFGYALPGIALLGWFWRREPPLPVARPKIALCFATLSLAVGSFWYARNTILFGNPVHPVTRAGFVTPEGEVIQRVGPDLRSLQEGMAALVDDAIYDRSAAWSAWMRMSSGWGPLVFACGIPALLLALRAEARWRRLGAAFLVSLAGIFLCVRTDPWFMRFALFFSALPALAAARLAEEMRPLRFVLGFCLAIQFVGSLVPGEWPIEQLSAFVHQPWRDRRFLQLVVDTPKDKAIGCLAPGGRRSYQLYGPDFSTRVVTLRVKDADDLIETMNREGLRTLYASHQTGVLLEALRRKLVDRSIGSFYRLR